MACFLVSAAGAVVATAAGKAVEHKEEAEHAISTDHAVAEAEKTQEKKPITFGRKLMWLAYMLWGGAFLLMFEHVWHGEVVPWFPFLTNASNPADVAEMLHEMGTVGVTMLLLIIAVWAGICAVTHVMAKRDTAEEEA